VVASHKHPGLLWTINDSGGDATLFLTDTTGVSLGTFVVRGAVNVDWEALARGPCGATECLFIGDTGDNREQRPSVTIYRVPEPNPAAASNTAITAKVELITVKYPDGAHDVEAMYVEPDGAVMLVTKGRRGGVLAFRVPASAWSERGPVAARRTDSLPIATNQRTGRVITDAAISPDGRRVAVRTYRDIRIFARAADGHFRPEPARRECDIAGVEPQGEGIDWWEGDTMVLTSERGLFPAGTITLVTCPR
jgi:hypothetical protein